MALIVLTNALQGPHCARCRAILDFILSLTSPSMKSDETSRTSWQSSSLLLNKLKNRKRGTLRW